jgi:hypothetical protein
LIGLAAFWLGHWHGTRQVAPAPPRAAALPVSDVGRDRILFTEIGNHLEQSERALIELVHRTNIQGQDAALEQSVASELLAANRLYRRTAAGRNDLAVARVLEELEPILAELAHSPANGPSAEFADLQQRVENDGLLFKLKVIRSKVVAREHETARQLAGHPS